MITKLQSLLIGLVLLASLVQTQIARAAVSFTVTPSAVSNTYSGYITLQIGGIASGDTVVVQKFLDVNTNGVIDANDLLVQQFSLTDGQAGMVIGGVTNFNVPGDTDGTANGQITAALFFQNGDLVQNIVGNYLFTLSSPAGHFTPITNQFAVTNLPYAQEITGTVVSNGTSTTVPNALVFIAEYGGPHTPVAGVVANNAGGFAVQLPPATYVPFAISRSNYVFNTSTSPVLTLAAGQSITTNLTLSPATASISGSVVDGANASIVLPGLVQTADSANGAPSGFTLTASNGNFTMPVTAGQWELGSQNNAALGVHGYVGRDSDNHLTVSAGATGVSLTFSKATALIYGSVKDNSGNPLPGIAIEASDNNGLYEADGVTDVNGNYVLGVLGGLSSDPWTVDINNGPTNYSFSGQTINGTISVGQAALQNFTGTNLGTTTAISFTVMPAAVSNTYTGAVTLQITGLTNGETVVIKKYLDLNTNGVVDTNDLMVRDFQLTAGQSGAMVIGGVTNVNVPFNSNANTNAITTTLNFQNGQFIETLVAQYLFVVSCASGQVTNSLVVTNSYAQQFTGTVVSGVAPIPNAVVLLLPALGRIDNAPTPGTVANNSGIYTLPAPVGTYALAAYKTNFVTPNTTATYLALSNGQTFTTNLSLTPATESISGAVIDATTSNGLPGVLVVMGSSSGLGLCYTDSNGYFTGGVTAGQWTVNGEDAAVALLGYVGLNGGVPVNAASGSVTNVIVAENKASALFYGYFTNNLGTPLAGFSVEAEDLNENYDSFGSADANGYYVTGALGGLGAGDAYEVNLASDYGPTNEVFAPSPYTYGNGGTNLATNTAVKVNFTVILATNYVTGWLKDNYGNPIAGVQIYDFDETPINGAYYEGKGAITDPNGNYVLNVCNGTWDIYVDDNGGDYSLTTNYIPPADQYPVIANNNAVVNFTATNLSATTASTNFTVTTNNGTITITGYTGTNSTVIIPTNINGLTVTSIGDDAFAESSSMTSVTIPNTVTNIGIDAFGSALTEITVVAQNSFFSSTNGVLFDKMQTALLEYPKGLAGSYTIPDSVTSIGDYAFYYCQALTSITIDTNDTSIGNSAFYACFSLTSVTIPNSVTNIGEEALSYCSLTNVTIGTDVADIGAFAFAYCIILTNITIPGSVTSIGDGAFIDCQSLTNIMVNANNSSYSSTNGVLFNKSQTTLFVYPDGKVGISYSIPSGVTSIGDYAFVDCASLTSVSIPSSVINIGAGVFEGCTALTAILVSPSNPYYISIAGVLFNLSQTMLIQYPAGKAGTSYTIPSNVTSIGVGAFFNCTGLTNVTIPGNVNSIGEDAFAYCYSLTNIYFQGNAPIAYPLAFYFDYKNPTVYYLPGTIGWGSTFGGIPTAQWLLPTPLILDGNNNSPSFGVQTNKFGFTVSWATNLSIVLEACTNLASPVWIPLQTNPLINGSFYFSDSQWTNYHSRFYRLGTATNTTAAVNTNFTFTTNNGTITITGYTGTNTTVIIPGTVNGLPVTGIGNGAFQSLTSITSITIPDGVTSIGNGAFFFCASLSNITIPSSVTNIGNGPFADCIALTAITVNPGNPAYISSNGILFNLSRTTLVEYPDGKAGAAYMIPGNVTSIGGFAFYGCSSLVNVTIPNGVTNIGANAFQDCPSLTTVTIPNSVTNIGIEAFFGCSSLTTVTIPNGVTSIGLDTFAFCSSLINVTIPDSVTNIAESALYDTSLTNVTIPGSVTSLGDYAFSDSSSLRGVYFQGNAPTADATIFTNDNNATVYYLPGTTGWGTNFGGRPTAPWYLPSPLILDDNNNSPSFGVQTNKFGFTISWATNVSVIVEAATNLANATWIPLQTNTLTNGTFYFSDAQWTNYRGRYYRIVAP